MKKITKTIITMLLAVILIINTNIPVHAQTAYDDTYTSSWDKASRVYMVTAKTDIIFKDLPDEKGFQKKILVSLYSEDKDETLNKQQITIAPKQDVTYSLSSVKDGTYFLQLYKLKESGTAFQSYWLKSYGVKLRKASGKITFLQHAPYETNQSLHNSHLTGQAVLDYYLQPSSLVDCNNPVIRKKALEITKGITDDYGKVKAVHDWVAKNIWYDYDKLYHGKTTDYLASDVMTSKKSVCQGFADLAAALLRSLGIPTKVTAGYALGAGSEKKWTDDILNTDKTNHAWNESFVNGRWVIYDCTWDSSNKYEYGTYSKNTGLLGHRYFDMTIESLSATHLMMDEEKELRERFPEETKTQADTQIETQSSDEDTGAYMKETSMQQDYSAVSQIIGTDNTGSTAAQTASLSSTTAQTGSKTTTEKTAKKPQLSITTKNKRLKKGKTRKLTVKKKYISGKIKWKSSNKKIASVLSSGKVRARKKGKVTITAYAGTVKASLKLTVY